MKSIVIAIVCWICSGCMLNAAPPVLVRSEPAIGAKGVATNVGVLRFHFNQNMKQNSWTIWRCDKGEFPPLQKPDDNPWRDARTAELRVAGLKPNTVYAVQLNSTTSQGFRSALENEPLAVTVIVFTTGNNTGQDIP